MSRGHFSPIPSADESKNRRGPLRRRADKAAKRREMESIRRR